MYKCEIIADSINLQEDRLTTFMVTYPRIIHAEMCRHRMFSRNTASSRAIPFKKMVEDVRENPFIPIAWQKDHKGMQGIEYITDKVDLELNKSAWLRAKDNAITEAKYLNHGIQEGRDNGVTKQLCNRLLEPFVWTTELITTGEDGLMNFFELRCPKYIVNNYSRFKNKTIIFKSRKEVINHVKQNNLKSGWENCESWEEEKWLSINNSQAEIHIQKIAEMMWDAYNESKPKYIMPGEWHNPFGDQINHGMLRDYFWLNFKNPDPSHDSYVYAEVKIATARCARLSYKTLGDDPVIDYKKDIELHDRLLAQNHMSPFEHCARAMSDKEYQAFRKGQHEVEFMDNTENSYWFVEDDSGEPGWCRNFKGFVQYRNLVGK